jgi:hypothetical protein
MSKRTVVGALAILVITPRLGVLADSPQRDNLRPAVARQASPEDWCDQARRDQGRRREFACEVRHLSMAASGALDISGHPNGSISITGGSGADITISALVAAQARSEPDARALVRAVGVTAERGTVRASGPKNDDGNNWWVSYRVDAPRSIDVTADSGNGSVSVTGVSGTIHASTSNGSVHLVDVGGDVRGETSNGSVQVDLTGHEWRGSGLDVRSSNGSVRVTMPEDYSARLIAETGNGSLRFDRPITVRGRIGKEIDTTLGRGGATIRATTGNGSVSVMRK